MGEDDPAEAMLDGRRALLHDRAEGGGAPGQLFIENQADIGQGRRATDGVAAVGAGHGAGRELVKQVAPADDRRQGQAAADAFAAGDQVGNDVVMFVAPKGSGASEAGLDLVHDQRHAMPVAPGAQGLHVGGGSEAGVAALVGFADHAADPLRGHVVCRQGPLKRREVVVLRPAAHAAVGERHGEEVRVGITDPFLEGWNAARALAAQGPAVESIGEGDEHRVADTAAAGLFPAQLEAEFIGLGTGGEQHHLVVRSRCQRAQQCRQFRPVMMGEAVGGQQRPRRGFRDRRRDFRAAVAGVGDQDATGEVNPAVAPSVPHAGARGPVPDHRRLPFHAHRLAGAQLFQQGHRVWMRDRRLNTPPPG